ncbi:PREDICTED: mitogen-activated protein kinase kinase kinase 3-like [Camelina sativa]|uniref:Mitogen-activated protein kinase kinase kinase 3-like n=1 Tax=Camelina sativa TaxID=90675 RepID=A0ABM0X5I8_CAMSA|nr:PREDICTED: mitogen-activated protein kinase kinase kinase 3-like [Camelina sativa]
MKAYIDNSLEIASNKIKRIVAAPPTNKTGSESSLQIISRRTFEAAVYKLSRSFEVVTPPTTPSDQVGSSLEVISRKAFEATVSKRPKTVKSPDGSIWIRCHSLGAHGFVYLAKLNNDVDTNGLPPKMAIKCSPITFSSSLSDEERILKIGSSLEVISRKAFEATVSKRPKTVKSPDGSIWIRCHSLGAHGFVYLAKLNNDVDTNGLPPKMAIKCSPITFSSSLSDEERILKSLSSPYVISCYGSRITMTKSPANGSDYNLILEYCSGGSIADFLKFRGKPMVESDVQLLSTKILKGITYIHSKKIIHCDIKPGNILLTPQPNSCMPNCFEPKIADFGLALRKSSVEYGDGSGHKRGTLLYMSPEVLREGFLDYAADIWSFGCTVLEMLTGKKPWSEFQVLDRKKLEDFIAHSSFKPSIPSTLSADAQDFLHKCLDINPFTRFDSTALLNHKFLSTTVHDVVVKEE